MFTLPRKAAICACAIALSFVTVGCSFHASTSVGKRTIAAPAPEEVLSKTVKITRIGSEPRGEIRYMVYFIYSDQLPDVVLTGAPRYGNLDLLPLLKTGDTVEVTYAPDGSLRSIKLAK